MKYHVYITPVELEHQLTTVLDLPAGTIELPTAPLKTLIQKTIAALTASDKTGLFEDISIDGLREKSKIEAVPTPAWLSDVTTATFITGHQAARGSLHDFLWSEFLNSLLPGHWTHQHRWKVNEKGQGFPVLDFSNLHDTDADFCQTKKQLRSDIPPGWHVLPGGNQAHLNVVHPGLLTANMELFLETTALKSNIFPARTHPIFYVALYEFWQYLCPQPLWAHLPPFVMVDTNLETSEFSPQSLVSLGLAGATSRWSWWTLLSHVFAPRSRALDILVKHYPDCYNNGMLHPRPIGMSMCLGSAPPRLRVLRDPY